MQVLFNASFGCLTGVSNVVKSQTKLLILLSAKTHSDPKPLCPAFPHLCWWQFSFWFMPKLGNGPWLPSFCHNHNIYLNEVVSLRKNSVGSIFKIHSESDRFHCSHPGGRAALVQIFTVVPSWLVFLFPLLASYNLFSKHKSYRDILLLKILKPPFSVWVKAAIFTADHSPAWPGPTAWPHLLSWLQLSGLCCSSCKPGTLPT